MKLKKIRQVGMVAGAAILVAACSHSDKLSPASYEITLSNLTENQPMSPLAVMAHSSSYAPWTIGTAASSGLEKLAESGMTTDLLAEATAAGADSTVAATAVVLPGASDSVTLEVKDMRHLQLSVASMLVNTNDAFAGASGTDISQMPIGSSMTLLLPVYDAGTEANSEAAGTIPGPADGGEGYNATRDDVNVVSRHPGIVGSDSGYTASVLNSTHGFDNPVAQLTIRRLD